MNSPYQIRPAQESDLQILNDIENAAAYLFQNTKYALEIDLDPLSIGFLKRQLKLDLIWVAVDQKDLPVGFAVLMIIDNYVHLHELCVHPEHGQKGLGTLLTQRVIQFAQDARFLGVTLSTFRDIPWNAPFYKKLGFQEIPADDTRPGLAGIRKKEAEMGLPVKERVLMKFEFSG